MKIAICTGTYPPEIGGSSDYSAHLFAAFKKQDQDVSIVTYGSLKRFPTGVRHILYFFKLCFFAMSADYIIALDVFSVAFPAVVFAKLFQKRIVIRVGGDFLWESYVERTKQPILLSQFYSKKREYTLKESIIFKIIHFVLHGADAIVFSTDWQKNIMQKPYDLNLQKMRIIENFYGTPLISAQNEADFSKEKIFLSPSRDISIKNKKNVRQAFAQVKNNHPEVVFGEQIVSHDEMLTKIKKSYAVIVVSLSEVSPNLALHALEYNIPVILTEDAGISDRLKNVAVFVNPLSIESITNGIETLLNPDIYGAYKHKLMQRIFVHSWQQIAEEFLDVYKKI